MKHKHPITLPSWMMKYIDMLASHNRDMCVYAHIYILNKSLKCKLQCQHSHVCYILCADHGGSLATSSTVVHAQQWHCYYSEGFSVSDRLKFLCMTSTLATNKDIFGWQLLVTSERALAACFFFLKYKMWPDTELTGGCWNKERREKSCPGEVIWCQMLPTHQT